MSNLNLNDSQRVALAGVCKGKDLDQAKAALPDGFSGNVDFCVRITGSIQKATGCPASVASVAAVVTLQSLDHVTALLRQLGVGAKRLRSALQAVQTDAAPDPELANVFTEVEKERAAKLPAVDKPIAAKAGAVQTQVSATLIDPPKPRK